MIPFLKVRFLDLTFGDGILYSNIVSVFGIIKNMEYVFLFHSANMSI